MKPMPDWKAPNGERVSMNEVDLKDVCDFANEEIVLFHEARLKSLGKLKLLDLLKRKNPYLFRARNLATASDLIEALMGAFLSSSEEKLFGDFLEELAVFVSSRTCGGQKSSAKGLDLEFTRGGTRYLVSIKSGPNWGNSSQYSALKADFVHAVKVLKLAHTDLSLQPVLGICYGRSKWTDTGQYLKLVGQTFWWFLSGDPDLYTDIIEPVGYRAKHHNDRYFEQRCALVNQFAADLYQDFCHKDGRIDWDALVAYNSGNLPPKGRPNVGLE